jgi:predicted nucleic acid-binding protein
MQSDSSNAGGLLDTNIFLHAHTHDAFSEECRHFLAALEAGRRSALLEPLILHELSYALPHYLKQMTRSQVAAYLLMVLAWPGMRGEKSTMIDAVQRWRDTPGLAFADAYLAAIASRDGTPVFTKNVRELRGQDALVPEPLPNGADETEERAH